MYFVCVLAKMYLNLGSSIFLDALEAQSGRLCWRPSRQDMFVSAHVYCVENECRMPDIHHINAL